MEYIVCEEDGTSKLILEEGTGDLLLEEASATPDGSVDVWNTSTGLMQPNPNVVAPLAGGLGVSNSYNLGASGYVEGVVSNIAVTQTADSGLGVTGIDGEVSFSGTHTSIGAIGVNGSSVFYGTKTAGAGNQLSEGAIGGQFTGVTDSSSTGDIYDVLGIFAQAILNGANVIGHSVSAIRAYASVGTAAAGVASVRVLNGLYARVQSSGRTVAEAHGVEVDTPLGVSNISVNYGVRVHSQTGAGTSYGISVEGGTNQFVAGAAGEVPMQIKAISGQTANLAEIYNASGVLKWYVDSAGTAHQL